MPTQATTDHGPREPRPTAARLRAPARAVARSRVVRAVLCLGVAGLLVLRAENAADLIVVGVVAGAAGLLAIAAGNLERDLARARVAEARAQRDRDRKRFEILVQHAADVVLVVGHSGHVTYASPSAAGMFGADPTGWPSEQLVAQLHPDEREATAGALAERLGAEDGRPVRIRARLLDREGRELHAEVVAVDLLDDPDVGGIVITIHDTTERAGLEAELRKLAFHDPLTGLPNRTLFQDRLVQAIARSQRTGRPIAVLVCDLDDFKDVNDTLGHPAGDRLLQALADRFEGSVRAVDTVARIGGDEFAVLVEGLDATRDAIAAARRLLAATDAPIRVEDTDLRIGLSVGIAVDNGARSADEMLRDADIALYEAKALGKQRWSLHRTTMTIRAQARLQLGADLAGAVAAGSIDVVFQPIHELADGQLVGAEALARWEHPHRGTIPPDEFISLAEANGLILPLGDHVLDAALGALAGWSRRCEGLVLRLGVNVSPRQLRDPSLYDRVRASLTRHGVPADRLVLELTESVMLDDPDQALEIMYALRELGVRFAVDDFGTGYSSLSYLRRLPVDIVKIDRSFISELTIDHSAYDLVRSIVHLAGEMGLDAVAEGVETEVQRDLLRGMGCGFAQGYLFGRPALDATFPLPARSGLPSAVDNGFALGRVDTDVARGA